MCRRMEKEIWWSCTKSWYTEKGRWRATTDQEQKNRLQVKKGRVGNARLRCSSSCGVRLATGWVISRVRAMGLIWALGDHSYITCTVPHHTITYIRNNHSNENESDNGELDSSDDEFTGKERIYIVFSHIISVFNRWHIVAKLKLW